VEDGHVFLSVNFIYYLQSPSVRNKSQTQKMKTILHANLILFIRCIMLTINQFFQKTHTIWLQTALQFKTTTCFGAKAPYSGNLKYKGVQARIHFGGCDWLKDFMVWTVKGKDNTIWNKTKILYFVDHASRYNSLLMANLTHLFIYVFI
jgi:hypothetical protein